MTFDPRQHLTKIQNKDYLEVKWRIVWFREEHPDGSIHTEIVSQSANGITFKATASFPLIINDGLHIVSGVGHAFELWEKPKRVGSPHENGETSAVGRALAHLGYGTQFAPEFDMGDRLADSPVANVKAPPRPTTQHQGQSPMTTITRDRRSNTDVVLHDGEGWSSEQVVDASTGEILSESMTIDQPRTDSFVNQFMQDMEQSQTLAVLDLITESINAMPSLQQHTGIQEYIKLTRHVLTGVEKLNAAKSPTEVQRITAAAKKAGLNDERLTVAAGHAMARLAQEAGITNG